MKIGDRVFVRGYIDEIRKDTVIIRNAGGYFGTIPSEVITEELPSAQPKERTEERVETHACDLIDRQAAIDALDERFDKIPMEKTTEILKLRKDLRELPSIQSEQISNCKSTLEDIYRAGYANGLDDIQMEFSTDFAVNILSQLEYILKWKIKDGLLASSDVADGLRIALREIDRLKGYIEAGDGEK